MLILIRSGVRWKFCEKPLLSLMIVYLLVLSGIGRGATLNLAQDAQGWNGLGSSQSSSAVLSLAIDPSAPSTLYAGMRGAGVFKSSDGGTSWQAINTGLPNNASVQTLIINPMTPSTLYVGTNQGVFKSSDGGESWRALNLTRSVTAMLIDPRTQSRLYAAGACNGVFKSDNEGTSWTAINTGLGRTMFGFESLPFLTALVIDPTSPTTLYAGALQSIFKTTNGGASWQPIYGGLSIFVPFAGATALMVDPVTPTILYAGVTGSGEFRGSGCGVSFEGFIGGVIKSNDGGGTWMAINTGLPGGVSVIALAIDPNSSSTVYAGTQASGIFKTSDGGANWMAINKGLPEGITIYALAVDPQMPSTLYAGTSQGVFKSTNGGERWSPASL